MANLNKKEIDVIVYALEKIKRDIDLTKNFKNNPLTFISLVSPKDCVRNILLVNDIDKLIRKVKSK